LVRLACERDKLDHKRNDLDWDPDSANAACENFEYLPHVKGKWAGNPFVLEDWQCFVVCSIFGWKRKDNGKRRFRYAYLQIPRKNGKTSLAVGIALLLFAADEEEGAEAYLGATAQDHAKQLLYFPAKRIVEMADDFREHFGIEVGASSMIIPSSFSRLTTVIRKPDDGASPHVAVVDEYHEHDTDDQWSTFDTGMGAREQPLLLTTTTAGANLAGPCKIYRDDCVRGLESDPHDATFALIYEPDEGDAWDDESTLRKVNPNLGVSVSESFLLDQLEQARRSASKQNAYRTKHLNQWVGAKVAWMNMLAWQRQKKTHSLQDYEGRVAYLGVDLASKKDVAAIGIVIPDSGTYNVFTKLYAPEAAAEENDQYRVFARNGSMTLTDGSATDYATIQGDIEDLCSRFKVSAVAFDAWQAQFLMQRLAERRLPVEEFPHQVRTMSDPMKEMESLVLDGRLWHDGDPALTWMMGNVAARMDAKENIYPNKANPNDPRCKIDGVVALIMALGLAVREREEGTLDDWLNYIKGRA
jgi:phage terminase large subunit-like protein